MRQAEVAPAYRKVGDVSVEAGRGPGQLPWYEYAARTVVPGKSVLDAGCGLALGLAILARTASTVRGQDLDPRLARPDVHIGPLSEIPDKSVDVVTAIDIIEHVEDDAGFVRDLARIARERVFVATPNWAITRCEWPYHVREYTPRQLRELLGTVGRVTLFKGSHSGSEIWPVENRSYDLLNDARIWPPKAFAARCLSRLLPRSVRLHPHLAALVDVATGAAPSAESAGPPRIGGEVHG